MSRHDIEVILLDGWSGDDELSAVRRLIEGMTAPRCELWHEGQGVYSGPCRVKVLDPPDGTYWQLMIGDLTPFPVGEDFEDTEFQVRLADSGTPLHVVGDCGWVCDDDDGEPVFWCHDFLACRQEIS